MRRVASWKPLKSQLMIEYESAATGVDAGSNKASATPIGSALEFYQASFRSAQ